MYNDNFKGIVGPEGTFSLDFHSFKPVIAEENLSELTMAQLNLQQRQNMMALLAMEIDLGQVHADLVAKKGERVYVLNRENATRAFRPVGKSGVHDYRAGQRGARERSCGDGH